MKSLDSPWKLGLPNWRNLLRYWLRKGAGIQTDWTRIGDSGQLRLVIDVRTKEQCMDAKPRKPYPSDLTDAQWAIVEPLLPPPVPAGAPRKTNLREVLNAIFYVLSTGCAWSALPHDFPPEGTVRDYFHQWRRRGVWQQIHDVLRGQVREAAGKEPQPSAGSIDSQTVKATRTSGERGYDAGKKTRVAKLTGKPSGWV
jgi:transposase